MADEIVETETEPTDNQSISQSRLQQEPRGHLIDEFSMMLSQQNNTNQFTGNNTFTGSPIGLNSSRSVSSSAASAARSESSSIASTPTIVKSKLGESDLTGKQMDTFANIIAEAFVQANKKDTSKYDTASMPPLGVTGVTLHSGLDVLHVPRSGNQQDTAGITSKYSRGNSESDRLKRKKTVTVALDDQLACNNILSLITAGGVDKHDLAADCQQWQVGINGFKKVLIENDMLTPFLIPARFDLDDPALTAGPFTNLIVDFHKISDETAQRWQQYLRKYAAPVELESASWAVQIMERSMTAELKTLVRDDIHDLDSSAIGAITMFKIVTNHMVLRNQETIDALQEWIRTFDIRKVDGENVSIACTQCRAVIRALDDFGLPANTLRCILDGFSNATNDKFKQLCTTLSTMNRSVLMQNFHVTQSIKQKCFAVLKDLETTYIDLSTADKWTDVSHNTSAFVTEINTREQGYAMAARHQVPFEEWVKDRECHACGKKGHIKPDCPDAPPSDKGSPYRDRRGGGGGRGRGGGGRGRDSNDYRGRGRSDPIRGHRSQRDKQDRRFKKAYKLALESFANDSSSDDNHSEQGDAANDSDGSDSENSLAAHAARMYSSLKE